MAKIMKVIDWDKLTDEELLQIRIRDFHLNIQNSPLELLTIKLYDELASKDIIFRPPCYLADE
jgi:hypothetical protein